MQRALVRMEKLIKTNTTEIKEKYDSMALSERTEYDNAL